MDSKAACDQSQQCPSSMLPVSELVSMCPKADGALMCATFMKAELKGEKWEWSIGKNSKHHTRDNSRCSHCYGRGYNEKEKVFHPCQSSNRDAQTIKFKKISKNETS